MRRELSALGAVIVAAALMVSTTRPPSDPAPVPAHPRPSVAMPSADVTVVAPEKFEVAARKGMRFKTGISLAGLILTLHSDKFELLYYSANGEDARSTGQWWADENRLVLMLPTGERRPKQSFHQVELEISHTRPFRLSDAQHALSGDSYVQMPLIEERVFSTPTGTAESDEFR